MKKFIQIVTAAILSVGFIGSVAGAAGCTGDIEVHTSGNNDTTTISCSDVNNISYTCENNTLVANISYQDGKSGPATVGGSENGGSATSGDVTNTDNTTTEVGVTGCAASATVSPSPSPSTSVTPTSGTGATKAASLPNTAANDTARIIAVSLVAAAAVAGLSRAGVAAYRRIGNK